MLFEVTTLAHGAHRSLDDGDVEAGGGDRGQCIDELHCRDVPRIEDGHPAHCRSQLHSRTEAVVGLGHVMRRAVRRRQRCDLGGPRGVGDDDVSIPGQRAECDQRRSQAGRIGRPRNPHDDRSLVVRNGPAGMRGRRPRERRGDGEHAEQPQHLGTERDERQCTVLRSIDRREAHEEVGDDRRTGERQDRPRSGGSTNRHPPDGVGTTAGAIGGSIGAPGSGQAPSASSYRPSPTTHARARG